MDLELIDLCKLRSSCEKIRVPLVKPFFRDEQLKLDYQGNHIGLYSILSRVIHMTYFQFFDSAKEFRLITASYQSAYGIILSKQKEQYVNGFFILKENINSMVIIKLEDIIIGSIKASEKITEVCSDAQIHLELWLKTI